MRPWQIFLMELSHPSPRPNDIAQRKPPSAAWKAVAPATAKKKKKEKVLYQVGVHIQLFRVPVLIQLQQNTLNGIFLNTAWTKCVKMIYQTVRFRPCSPRACFNSNQIKRSSTALSHSWSYNMKAFWRIPTFLRSPSTWGKGTFCDFHMVRPDIWKSHIKRRLLKINFVHLPGFLAVPKKEEWIREFVWRLRLGHPGKSPVQRTKKKKSVVVLLLILFQKTFFLIQIYFKPNKYLLNAMYKSIH